MANILLKECGNISLVVGGRRQKKGKFESRFHFLQEERKYSGTSMDVLVNLFKTVNFIPGDHLFVNCTENKTPVLLLSDRCDISRFYCTAMQNG